MSEKSVSVRGRPRKDVKRPRSVGGRFAKKSEVGNTEKRSKSSPPNLSPSSSIISIPGPKKRGRKVAAPQEATDLEPTVFKVSADFSQNSPFFRDSSNKQCTVNAMTMCLLLESQIDVFCITRGLLNAVLLASDSLYKNARMHLQNLNANLDGEHLSVDTVCLGLTNERIVLGGYRFIWRLHELIENSNFIVQTPFGSPLSLDSCQEAKVQLQALMAKFFEHNSNGVLTIIPYSICVFRTVNNISPYYTLYGYFDSHAPKGVLEICNSLDVLCKRVIQGRFQNICGRMVSIEHFVVEFWDQRAPPPRNSSFLQTIINEGANKLKILQPTRETRGKRRTVDNIPIINVDKVICPPSPLPKRLRKNIVATLSESFSDISIHDDQIDDEIPINFFDAEFTPTSPSSHQKEPVIITQDENSADFLNEDDDFNLDTINIVHPPAAILDNNIQEETFLRKPKFQSTRGIRRKGFSYHSIGDTSSVKDVEYFSVGNMIHECQHCHALLFESETKTSICCAKGKIILPAFEQNYPQFLKDFLLYNNTTDNSEHFNKYILPYNSAHSFGSLGADFEILRTNGPPVVRVHGIIQHLISRGAVHKTNPRYAQLYYLEAQEANQVRESFNQNLNIPLRSSILNQIDEFIREVNPYAAIYKQLRETIDSGTTDAYIHFPNVTGDRRDIQNHPHVINRPTADEVCAIMSEAGPSNREIVVHPKDVAGTSNQLININIVDPNKEPLTFTLLFPHGEQRWNILTRSLNLKHTKMVSYREFVAYCLMTRNIGTKQSPNFFNSILAAGKLTQQFLIDCGITMEDLRLLFLSSSEFQEKKLLRDSYQDLQYYLQRRATDLDIQPGGIRTVLPSNHYGSDRWYELKCREAMLVQTNIGKPFLFVTMTMDQNCSEVKETLNEEWRRYGGCPTGHQFQPVNRPDIVSRVFKMKLNQLLKEIKEGLFGPPAGIVYTVEWQKRQNPHVHITIFVNEEHRPDIDQIISAEIPVKDDNPILHELVTKLMLHHACDKMRNASCRAEKTNKCSKRFPKPYSDHTIANVNGYPVYRRRQGGVTVTDRSGNFLNNRYVVSYNPYLLMRFRCHINVEYVASIRAVGYLFKYQFKGDPKIHIEKEIIDRTTNTLHIDEIQAFRKQRYMSAPQAVHRLLAFELQYNYHTIYELPVHLPGEQTIVYGEGYEEEAVERGAKTRLTEFFALMERTATKLEEQQNLVDYLRDEIQRYKGKKWARSKEERLPEELELLEKFRKHLNLLYNEVALHFAWKVKTKTWEERKRNREHRTMSRMHMKYPRQGEPFYLRLLLTVVRGPTSFEYLRTVNGVVYSSFREACIQRGILTTDKVWEATLREVSNIGLPVQVRSLFVYLILFNDVHDTMDLWNKCKDIICLDIAHARKVPDNYIEDVALFYIDIILQRNGKNLSKLNLPQSNVTAEQIKQWYSTDSTNDLEVDFHYNPVEEQKKAEENLARLNSEQRSIVDEIITALDSDPLDYKVNRLFCITGPGGVGKTLVLTTILQYARGNDYIALAQAFSGLAASLLPGASTLHSRFKLPIQRDQNQEVVCGVPKNSPLANTIRNSKLIVIDEATLMPKDYLDAIQNLCRDLDLNNRTDAFVGKVIVLCGDWRQCLPIVRHAGKAEILRACLTSSIYWPMFKSQKLKLNMRLQDGDSNFRKWMDSIGDGQCRDRCGTARYPDLVEIPNDLIATEPLEDVIFGKSIKISEDVSSKVILSPLSVDVRHINDLILNRLEGTHPIEFLSDDSVVCDNEDEMLRQVSVEDLHALNPSGFPLHCLKLKIGCMVILLRNLNPREGLCNGTRMKVRVVRTKSIECEIVSGDYRGKIHFIPRISQTTDEELPFTLKRVQFPLALCYAMTITKSQGQSFDNVGIFLNQPVFTHGQLYVAISRTRYRDRLKFAIEDTPDQGKVGNKTFTPNIVYKEVFNHT